jgi:hypothetical protein
MKSKTYNDEVQSNEKDFETLQFGAFVTPGLLLAQETVYLTAESGINPPQLSATTGPSSENLVAENAKDASRGAACHAAIFIPSAPSIPRGEPAS